jgi:hypothetical protein
MMTTLPQPGQFSFSSFLFSFRMSHAQSPSSPAGSKAALLGANPISGHHEPAAWAQPAASGVAASLPASLAGRLASLQTIGTQLLTRFKSLTTTEKVLGGLLLVSVVRHFTRSH